MTRLYNRESLVVLLIGIVVVLLAGWLADLGLVTLMLFAGWLVAALPIAMKVQHAILPLYLRFGFNQRALNLAVDIWESAPNRKRRDLASLDLAMVHAATGRFKDALKSLVSIKDDAFGDLPRALILANRSWCRAHLENDLGQALEEARKAIGFAPNEGILHYFEGLVLHKRGAHAEARAAIERSFAEEKDRRLPTPGERSLFLGDVLRSLGDEEGARLKWQQAAKDARAGGPFAEIIAMRLAADSASEAG